MSNEILWILMILANMILILFFYRMFGIAGLLCWVPVSIIIANLQVIKIVNLFGLTSSLGNIVYATSFLATDILTENHGEKNAKKAIFLGFSAQIVLTLLMGMSLLFKPSTADFAHPAMVQLYSVLPRIVLASLLAYLISQTHDVFFYSKLKSIQPDQRWIWFRSFISTMTSQAIDTIIFVSIAFIGQVSIYSLLQIALSTYVFKWIVSLLNTPVVYLASGWNKKGLIGDKTNAAISL